MALFPQGIGFLALKVRLLEDRPTAGRLNDFLYYLRLIHPPKLDWRLASWRLAGDRIACSSRDLVDFFLQGQTHCDQFRPELSDFLPYLTKVPGRARYTGTPHGQVYGGVFHLFSYACLGDGPAPAGGNDPAGRLFPSATQRALYELATCSRTDDPDYVPHRAQLDAFWRDNHIALWDNWQGLALQDNVVFLGTCERGFARDKLPRHVESDYFHLYLLVLFQKTRLSLIFGDLIRRETGLAPNLARVRAVWDHFMTFQNLYWYREVTRKPQGTALYRRFQQGLEVLPLYEEAAEQSRELQGYYESRVQRRTNNLLLFLTIIGVPLGALTSVFGSDLYKQGLWWQFLVLLPALPASIYGLWLAWEKLWSAWEKSRVA